MTTTGRLVAAVLENIGVPIASYLILTAIGWTPVWALVGGAGMSVLILAAQYLRRREVNALGVLVLARFAFGVTVAVITGDPRLELVKDAAVTFLIGLAAAVSLGMRRPLIARIRRDISADRDAFDRHWDDEGFRRLHRHLTLLWTAGLCGQSLVATALVYTLPLTAAVLSTSVLSPVTLLALIAYTQYRAHRWSVAHANSDAVRRVVRFGAGATVIGR
ncbi:VC0807 family protein [Kibdelosporangium phytohabitans]|uniref:DUF3159 domain-containing protein n=1 Tax=Kibdelosporangium phytohabitans TaxID=860235 RepID=A0A0N9I4M4_9PSEU|nr:VC0807 family protein [Kibdelosporangium phytohabitans]ALG09574.1 hypothetical protein AOZ06_24110 [Kibdelosporangium phytohabitans]MBE1469098.1 hypothetical protein [Kibdelosporangium phytohabitans]